MDLWILLMLVILMEALLHYFPWRMLLKGKKLHRLAAYSLGLLGMMGPFTVWLWQTGEIEIIKALWTVIAAAGLTVFALYGLDHYLDIEMKLTEAEEREKRNATQS